MSITHLPTLAASALRVETMANSHYILRTLAERRPSMASRLLGLAVAFVETAEKAGIEQSPQALTDAFTRALGTFLSAEFAPHGEEAKRALECSRDDTLPNNTNDVIVMLRKEAVDGATPIQNERT